MRGSAVAWGMMALAVISAVAYPFDDLPAQIRAAQSSGDYLKAAVLYRQWIAAGNESAETRSNFGIMLQLAGKHREALEQFRIALRANPSMPGANLFAGLAEIDLGEPAAALPYLESARKLDPSGPAPLVALGKAYVALRGYLSANRSYSAAVKMDPRLAEAWFGVGITDRSLAEERLSRAARGGVSVNKPALRKEAKQYLDDALRALSRAIALDPNSPRAHLILAESLSESGNLVEAIPEFQTVIRLNPKLDAAYLGLATAYWRQRQFDDALPLLRRILSTSPKDPEANAIFADILEHNGDSSAARNHANLALAGNPQLLQAHVVLARVYLTEQRPQLAIAELKKVVAADPDGTYHFLLSRACKQAGDDTGARAALAESQRLRNRVREP